MILTDSMLHFLSALGNSVLNGFWQMGLLWFGVVIISKYKKSISPEILGSLSFVALVTGFIAFATTFIISYSTSKPNTGLLVLIANSRLPETLMSYAAMVYLFLLVIPIAKLALGYNQVYQLKRKGLHRAPGIYKIFMLDAKSYLGIKRKVQLWVSEIAETPLTIGFFKPVILLPVAMLNNLTTNQVEAIILHELAHIKKNDYLINFVGQLIMTVLYFNPFAKALLQIHNLEREKAADTSVLQFEYNNYDYASTLLQLARQNNLNGQMLTLQAAGSNDHLLNRVKWITGRRERPVPSYKKIASSLGLIVLFLLLSPANKSIQKTGALGLLVASSSNPGFAYTSLANKNADYDVRQIPSLIENVAVSKPVYLKKVENSETGQIEILTPTEHTENITPAFVLAGTPTIAIPKLAPDQEANVQQSIAAVKKIFAESNWKQIETNLAESLTAEQKAVLKEAFKTRINESDWKDQANLLRLEYNNINWEKAKADLNLDVAYIKLDSVYNHYSSSLEKYHALKNEITNDKAGEINKKIADTRIILMKADSIRKKRITEL